MAISQDDMEEVKEQYTELMKQSIERFPGVGEFILHTSIIDWLNKEFDPEYKHEE
jgi:hypothetical protein